MINALFVDLAAYRFRKIFWEGGLLHDQFDNLLNFGDLDTVKFEATVCGTRINVLHSCGAKDDRFGWQLIDYPSWTFYSSSIILGSEDSSYPYSDFYIEDCELTLEQLCDNVQWCRIHWFDASDRIGLRELKWRASRTEILT